MLNTAYTLLDRQHIFILLLTFSPVLYLFFHSSDCIQWNDLWDNFLKSDSLASRTPSKKRPGDITLTIHNTCIISSLLLTSLAIGWMYWKPGVLEHVHGITLATVNLNPKLPPPIFIKLAPMSFISSVPSYGRMSSSLSTTCQRRGTGASWSGLLPLMAQWTLFYRGIDTDPTSCGTSIAIADCPRLREGYPPRRGTLLGGVPSQEDVKYHSTCPHWTPLLISGEQSTPVQSNVKGCISIHFSCELSCCTEGGCHRHILHSHPFPPNSQSKIIKWEYTRTKQQLVSLISCTASSGLFCVVKLFNHHYS